MIQLPKDFKDFLKLLHSNGVKYLLVGGYAVGYYGFPRATGDMDVWIDMNPENASKMVHVLKEFGFQVPELDERLFQKEGRIIRMGIPPVRIEILTSIDGVKFDECHASRKTDKIDGVEVQIIGLGDLKKNKKASGRHKDLNDLENLP